MAVVGLGRVLLDCCHGLWGWVVCVSTDIQRTQLLGGCDERQN